MGAVLPPARMHRLVFLPHQPDSLSPPHPFAIRSPQSAIRNLQPGCWSHPVYRLHAEFRQPGPPPTDGPLRPVLAPHPTIRNLQPPIPNLQSTISNLQSPLSNPQSPRLPRRAVLTLDRLPVGLWHGLPRRLARLDVLPPGPEPQLLDVAGLPSVRLLHLPRPPAGAALPDRPSQSSTRSHLAHAPRPHTPIPPHLFPLAIRH